MNCKDCKQGPTCPLRQACELPLDDDLLYTFDDVMGWMLHFFSAVGLTAVLAALFVWFVL